MYPSHRGDRGWLTIRAPPFGPERTPQVILDNACRRGPWSKRSTPFGQNFLGVLDGISIVFARLEVSLYRAVGKSLKQTRLSTSTERPMALRYRQNGDAASLSHGN